MINEEAKALFNEIEVLNRQLEEARTRKIAAGTCWNIDEAAQARNREKALKEQRGKLWDRFNHIMQGPGSGGIW